MSKYIGFGPEGCGMRPIQCNSSPTHFLSDNANARFSFPDFNQNFLPASLSPFPDLILSRHSPLPSTVCKRLVLVDYLISTTANSQLIALAQIMIGCRWLYAVAWSVIALFVANCAFSHAAWTNVPCIFLLAGDFSVVTQSFCCMALSSTQWPGREPTSNGHGESCRLVFNRDLRESFQVQ